MVQNSSSSPKLLSQTFLPKVTLTDLHAILIDDSEFDILPKVTLIDLHAMIIDGSEFAFLPKVTLKDLHAI